MSSEYISTNKPFTEECEGDKIKKEVLLWFCFSIMVLIFALASTKVLWLFLLPALRGVYLLREFFVEASAMIKIYNQ